MRSDQQCCINDSELALAGGGVELEAHVAHHVEEGGK